MKAIDIKVQFDQETLKNIPKVIGKIGIPKLFDRIQENVKQYIPQDTGTLIISVNIYRSEDLKSGAIGYGSKIENDPLNKIALYQHERALSHNGEPGRSMREGTDGDTSIPGKKHAIYGRSLSIKISNELKKQRNHYQRGYRQKRNSGALSNYATKFLLRATQVAVKDVLKDFNVDLNEAKKK